MGAYMYAYTYMCIYRYIDIVLVLVIWKEILFYKHGSNKHKDMTTWDCFVL